MRFRIYNDNRTKTCVINCSDLALAHGNNKKKERNKSQQPQTEEEEEERSSGTGVKERPRQKTEEFILLMCRHSYGSNSDTGKH